MQLHPGRWQEHLQAFAKQGLRTLVLGRRCSCPWKGALSLRIQKDVRKSSLLLMVEILHNHVYI